MTNKITTMDIEPGKKISYLITAFETYALGDIQVVQKNKMPIAALILSVCFIDQVSGFIYDNTIRGQKNNTERSKIFVSDYLNKVSAKPYDKDELIELLRNKLVHNYSISDRKNTKHKKYALDYENQKLHLHREKDTIFINIEGFIQDLKKAFQIYKYQLITDFNLQKIAIAHFDIYGILVHKEIPVDNIHLLDN